MIFWKHHHHYHSVEQTHRPSWRRDVRTPLLFLVLSSSKWEFVHRFGTKVVCVRQMTVGVRVGGIMTDLFLPHLLSAAEHKQRDPPRWFPLNTNESILSFSVSFKYLIVFSAEILFVSEVYLLFPSRWGAQFDENMMHSGKTATNSWYLTVVGRSVSSSTGIIGQMWRFLV